MVWLTIIIIQMKTVLKSTPFVKARIKQDVWTCSNMCNYHYLNQKQFLSVIAILSLTIATSFTTLLIYVYGRKIYCYTTWIFHRKLVFTLYKFKQVPWLWFNVYHNWLHSWALILVSSPIVTCLAPLKKSDSQLVEKVLQLLNPLYKRKHAA